MSLSQPDDKFQIRSNGSNSHEGWVIGLIEFQLNFRAGDATPPVVHEKGEKSQIVNDRANRLAAEAGW